MTSIKTYTDTYGGLLPLPPLEDLRGLRDGQDLPADRRDAAEAWWLSADHPGFGLDAEHTASSMRSAGFSEPEIRDVLLRMLFDGGYFDHSEGGLPAPTDRELTDTLLRAVEKQGDAK